MLKNTKLVVPAALVMSVLAGLMLALGARPAPAPVTVAVVDIEKVFAGLAEKVVREAELQKKREEAQQRITDMEDRVKKLTTDIGLMPEGAQREDKIIEQVRLIFNTKNERDLSQEMLDREGGKVLRDLYNKIDTASEQLAKQQGFQMVLVNDENMPIREPTRDEVTKVLRSKKILFVDPTLDITANVITYMNNQFNANVSPGGGVPAPATPAAGGKK